MEWREGETGGEILSSVPALPHSRNLALSLSTTSPAPQAIFLPFHVYYCILQYLKLYKSLGIKFKIPIIIMIGPPGSGKTMRAKRLPTIIPPLTLEEALETTKIHSVAGKIDDHTALMTRRPFRSPHHTISDVAFSNYVVRIYLTLAQLRPNFGNKTINPEMASIIGGYYYDIFISYRQNDNKCMLKNHLINN